MQVNSRRSQTATSVRSEDTTGAHPSPLATFALMAFAFAGLVALSGVPKAQPRAVVTPGRPALHAPSPEVFTLVVVDSVEKAQRARDQGLLTPDREVRVVRNEGERTALAAEIQEIDVLRAGAGLPAVQVLELR